MFMLSNVLNAYRDDTQNFTVFMSFEGNIFTGKVYVTYNTLGFNFKNILKRLLARVEERNITDQFVVEKTTNWISCNVNYSIQMSKDGLTTELGKIPDKITDLLSHIQRQGVVFGKDYSFTEISCRKNNSDIFVNMISNDSYLTNNEFKVICKTSNNLITYDFIDPKKKLEAIKQQKSLMDSLITEKLQNLNGKLKGIRADYLAYGIKYSDELQVCLFYGFADIDAYERSVKLDFLSGADKDVLPVEKKRDSSQHKNLSANTKISEITLSEPFTKVVNRLVKDGRSSLTVNDFIHLNSYYFQTLTEVDSSLYSNFLSLKKFFLDALTSSKGNQTLPVSNFNNSSIEREASKKHDSNEIDIASLKPKDICIGDWEDILSVTHKAATDKTHHIKEIKLQICYFYKVLNKRSKAIDRELIKIKETADWLFPGDFVKQYTYISDETERFEAPKDVLAEKEKQLPRVQENKSNISRAYLEKDVSSSHNDFNVPKEVLKKINDCAYECYFDDKEMFQIFVDEQRDAYKELHNIKPKGMSKWVFDSILDFVSSKYIDDFTGQLTEAKMQLTSYSSIESILLPDDVDSLRKIKQELREDFPGDYKWQLKSLKEALNTLGLEKDDEEKQELALQQKDDLRPIEMSPLDWELLLAIVEKECPKDAIAQVGLIKLHVGSFYDIKNTTAIGFEDEFYNQKAIAKEMFAGDYVKQLSYLDRELETLSRKNFSNISENNTSQMVTHTFIENDFDTKNQAKEVQIEPEQVSSSKACCFSEFNEKNRIFVEIKSLSSFDAFEFEFINGRFVVFINSNHSFYSRLYKNSSAEQKNTINMLISSLCHLSHQNIFETVKLQDKKLFSRWSEYIEQWLLKD